MESSDKTPKYSKLCSGNSNKITYYYYRPLLVNGKFASSPCDMCIIFKIDDPTACIHLHYADQVNYIRTNNQYGGILYWQDINGKNGIAEMDDKTASEVIEAFYKFTIDYHQCIFEKDEYEKEQQELKKKMENNTKCESKTVDSLLISE